MALCALNDDALGMISDGLCNPLEPNIIVAFSSANKGLRALNQVLLQQLKADREVAAALCRRMGMGSCGERREAKEWPLARAVAVGLQLARALRYCHDEALPGFGDAPSEPIGSGQQFKVEQRVARKSARHTSRPCNL